MGEFSRCLAPECPWTATGNGLCSNHRRRWLAQGRPDISAWIAQGMVQLRHCRLEDCGREFLPQLKSQFYCTPECAQEQMRRHGRDRARKESRRKKATRRLAKFLSKTLPPDQDKGHGGTHA